jgi:hypothetical protein
VGDDWVVSRILVPANQTLVMLGAKSLDTARADSVGKPDVESTPGRDATKQWIAAVVEVPRTTSDQHQSPLWCREMVL